MNPDVIKSILARAAVTGVVAALTFLGVSLQDVGTSPETATLVATVLTMAVHAVHAFAARYGVDVDGNA